MEQNHGRAVNRLRCVFEVYAAEVSSTESERLETLEYLLSEIGPLNRDQPAADMELGCSPGLMDTF